MSLRHLMHGVAPGLCCLRNEHLTALQFHKDRQVSKEAHSATTHLFNFGNNVVTNALPKYFYTAYLATRLVPANKDDPADLPEGKTADCRPVKIRGSNRRLFLRAWLDSTILNIFRDVIGPVQNGVAIKGGISLTAYAVHLTMEANPNFGVTKRRHAQRL